MKTLRLKEVLSKLLREAQTVNVKARIQTDIGLMWSWGHSIMVHQTDRLKVTWSYSELNILC